MKRFFFVLAILAIAFIFGGCEAYNPYAAREKVIETVAVEKEVVHTVVVEKEVLIEKIITVEVERLIEVPITQECCGTPVPALTATPCPSSQPTSATPPIADNCPPGTWLGSNARMDVLMEAGKAYHLNVSRVVPPKDASAGGTHETNILVTLNNNIKWARIRWDGSGYLYPMAMIEATNQCQLCVETNAGNWPVSLDGIPEGIFVYHFPCGVRDANSYPDLLYSLEWEDASGVHSWPDTPTPTATPTQAMTPAPTDAACNMQQGVVAQGEGKTTKVCGYAGLYFYKIGGPEKVYLFFADGEVSVTNFNGTLVHWKYIPTSVDIGDKPRATYDEVKEAGVTITGAKFVSLLMN